MKDKLGKPKVIIGILIGIIVALVGVIFTNIQPNDVADNVAAKNTYSSKASSKKNTEDSTTEEEDESLLSKVFEKEVEYRVSTEELPYELPLAEDVRWSVIEQESNLGRPMEVDEKKVFLEDVYYKGIFSHLANPGMPSEQYDDRINNSVYDRILAQEFESELTVMDYQPYSTNNYDFVVNTTDFPFAKPTIVETSGHEGYSMEDSSRFFQVGDVMVGGFHFQNAELDGILAKGLNLKIFSSADLSDYEERHPDNKLIQNDYFEGGNVVQLTYFVRPTRRMNLVELYREALDVDVQLNENQAKPVPDVLSKEFNDLKEFFSPDSFGVSYDESKSEQEIIDDTLTVLPSGVAIVHQYFSVSDFGHQGNKMTFNDETFNLIPAGSQDIDLSQMY